MEGVWLKDLRERIAMLNEDLKKSIVKRLNEYPLMNTLRLEVISLSEGTCETKAPRNENFNGIFDSFHGGLLLTIADTSACIAIFPKTGPGVRLATTDMSIRFLAPCFSDVVAKAKVVKFGKTMCPVSIDLYDVENRHIAIAQVNYMILRKEGTSP
jgi:uncharacterized protein (TIGR00369 family)